MTDHEHSPTIELGADVGGFFQEAVGERARRGGYEASDATVTYVGALLADYARPDSLSQEALSRPVTLLLSEAQQCQGLERFERLRGLGDAVLYISSFFSEHIERRGVELGYVRRVGATAYHTAAAMMGRDHTGPDVFSELGSKFDMFAALLAEVAESLRAAQSITSTDVLKLYERWTRTRSAPLAEALARAGLTPITGSATVH
ncbi:MAG: hypothetical protein KIT72_05770 [Polyangiaceae bacterium]|nr:hypothetical protein [Polyangiaceae bacterium]MCW5789908.1 hypothetical protein [Polyangiaceae bacterium]